MSELTQASLPATQNFPSPPTSVEDLFMTIVFVSRWIQALLLRGIDRRGAALHLQFPRRIVGAGVFGTNNETLAAAVETAGGLIAKKLTEHEVFCYYKVTKGVPLAMHNPETKSDGQAAPVATR